MPQILFTAGVFLLIGLGIYLLYQVKTSPARKPHPEKQPAREPAYSLPESYGTDEVIAMIKDPNWLYTYWEVTGDKRAEFDRMFGKGSWETAAPLLRLYDLTGIGTAVTLETPYEDIPIDGYANNWYISAGRPNHTFCIDLGRRLPGGLFVTLARSNIVTSPSDQVSSVIDPMWPPIDAVWRTFGPTVSGVPVVRPGGVSSPVFFPEPATASSSQGNKS